MAPDPADRYFPAPDSRPIEAIIGNHIAKRAIVVAPVLVLVFGLFRGYIVTNDLRVVRTGPCS